MMMILTVQIVGSINTIFVHFYHGWLYSKVIRWQHSRGSTCGHNLLLRHTQRLITFHSLLYPVSHQLISLLLVFVVCVTQI